MNYKDREFLRRFASIGDDPQIFAGALILSPEKIVIGNSVRIDDFARIEGGMRLEIGNHVHIASFASVLAGGEAILGDFCGLAQGSRIITGFGHPFEHEIGSLPDGDPFKRRRCKVVIGKMAFVAANAVVLPGITVGEGGVVAAGSVATQDIPPWHIVAGVPAKVIRKRAK
jgi:galactoside O-acetyltransferase